MSTSAPMSGGDVQRRNLLSRLLDQPPEIIGKILETLLVQDLLNLRQVNHALHTLIHQHEKSICLRVCKRLEGQHRALRLAARVHGVPRDLVYQVDLQYHFKVCWMLSRILANHIVSHLRHTGVSDSGSLEAIRLKKSPDLQRALFPALFTLNNFLECMHVVITEAEGFFANWDDDTYATVTDVFMLDQQQIIQELCQTSEAVKDLAIVWIILQALCKAKKLCLNLKASQYPFATLKRILLCRGLPVMQELLTSSQDAAARISLLTRASERLWQTPERHHQERPLRTIQHLATDRVRVPDLKVRRSYAVVNQFLDNQEILSRAAFAVLQRQGKVDNPSWCMDPTSWIVSKICSAGDEAHSFTISGWSMPR